MKKFLFLMIFVISGLIFADTGISAKKDTGDTILELIKEVEEEPASEKNLPKYERIIKFAEESEEVQIFLIDELYKFPDAKVSQTNRRIIQGSYVSGALKKQLENKQKIITISDGIKNELKVYKILRETKYVKVEYLEQLLDIERQGGIGQLYYNYDVMGMEMYQSATGMQEDADTLINALKFPFFLEVSGEKVLITDINFNVLADLTTIIGFYAVSDDYDKSQAVLDKKSKEIAEKLLKNDTLKKIYEKNNYSGIMIEYTTPKVKQSKNEIYKIMTEKNQYVDMKDEAKQFLLEKEAAKEQENEK
ncbi:Uncharacterised protein [Sebaldella termitidis]|uniref:Uncharacterized protein n=1 Tax=Sebaldella termitidis (strain ATCC 33386 / NCTC 11300) TaxID=526218 RepID=D1AP66_SEBTE|nr:hypothetical protein [Sebaldella termitidis]ACZ09900.1 hypothetical protein Sterm_3058 [Sebaldella termitidis ATCC 33386]SUI25232.1 Uncharacterised protein [Sebaldella termitidis]